jgi:rhodanese-related sulfurtransferase
VVTAAFTTAPDIAAPETAPPDIAAPETAPPDIAAPETPPPGIAAPETPPPGIASPGTYAPGIAAPETGSAVLPGTPAVPQRPVPVPPPGSVGIDEILSGARARLNRLGPHAVDEALRRGAILVDIRPAAQRAEFGEIPAAIVIERNVLEWRLDPRSDARLPCADSYDLEVIVTCQEGYTSSLAAAALQDLGLHRATDLTGGFAAWHAAGLPTTP